MRRDDIAVIEYGTDAWDFLEYAVESGKDLRVVLDEGTLKVKVGQGMWSPPYENGTP